LIGQILGHYRIVQKIGTGGMGVVYRAHDDRLNRDVALKVLPANVLADEVAHKRFRREAVAISKLNHPNIGMIFDFDSENGVDYLVMEYITGTTLAHRLATGPLPEKELLDLGIQIASALEEAHERGVVHRDLKPANIMVTPKGLAKVLDFGLAKMLHPCGDTHFTASSAESHTVAGTYPYMSPEQLRGEAVDVRSDIYSFGVVLYEMVAGQRPFRDQIPARLIDAVLNRPPMSPSSLKPGISLGLENLILKALDKDPERRYQSARELRVDLQRLLTPSSHTHAVVPPPRRRTRKPITSIAILPLVNTSADPETEHVSDGITESIINALSPLPKLRVMARSTVFRYKGNEVNPITVGRELKVGAVLTGRLVQHGDMLNISTELVDVADGAQMWGEQYSRKLADILCVQEEIATEISSRLRLRLTRRERQRLARHYTENREAYQAYLRGRYMASKYTEDGMKKAIEYFRQAIEIDPAFALAYAGLAMTYWNVSAVQFAPTEVMPKAREAARRALEIDSQLAESHAAVALAKMAYEWDRPGAEREFQLATQLNPGYATVYQWHGWHLAIMGRLDDSIAELKHAQELDPLSEINTYIGLSYYWARQYDLAVEQFTKALELYPDFWLPHLYLGWTHLQQSHITRAHAELAEAFRLENSPWTVASLAHAWAVSGDRVQAHQMLAEIRERSAYRFVSPYFVARIFTGLGEKEQAFTWLEKAYDSRDECLTWLKVDPTMDSLRADPRYPDLLRCLGLPS
jgi:serine/threonine protein kinase/tetratricopeptide (TPR) repeat protein